MTAEELPEGASPEFVARVGKRIRVLRKARGWTVDQLAQASSLSRRMLTQVELGQANPSLVTVDRVARALSTDFAALSLPEATAGPDAAATVPPTVVWRDGQGSEGVLLGATAQLRAELWRWSLTPGARYQAKPDAAGAQEVHHVVAGTLALELPAGDLLVSAGETATIPSDGEYAYRNDGAITTVFFRVVTGA